MAIEVMRELYRIIEWRDGCVFRTQFIMDVWVDPDVPPPPGHQYVPKSDPNIVTIRTKK